MHPLQSSRRLSEASRVPVFVSPTLIGVCAKQGRKDPSKRASDSKGAFTLDMNSNPEGGIQDKGISLGREKSSTVSFDRF